MKSRIELKSEIKNNVLIKANEDDFKNGIFDCPNDITLIKEHAFTKCTNLTQINLPKVTEIEAYAFSGCINLNTVYMPETRIIRQSAFHHRTNLTKVSMPKVIFIESWAFMGCTGLTTLFMPELGNLSLSTFANCTNLTTVCIPKIKDIAYQAFHRTNLDTVILSADALMSSHSFPNCSKLKSLIIDSQDQILNIEKIRGKLPQDMKDREIFQKSKMIKGYFYTKEFLNRNIQNDIHPRILSYAKQLGFFKQETPVMKGSANNIPNSFFNRCLIQ